MRPSRDPRASVVVPCFNYGGYLPDALDSVLEQTLDAVEVIVVDDGSSDDSCEVVERLMAANPAAAVRLIRLPHSGSPSVTRNAGIAEARGEYILCLDADDKLDPGFLEACVAALDARADAAIAYGDQQTFGARNELVRALDWDTRRELDANFLGTASVFRRSAWEEIGGYDAAVGYEDWDFWISIVERGYIGVRVPGALWHYRAHEGGVYSRHTRDDQRIKASIILKHPSLYSDRQRGWAAGILEDDALALAVDSPTGVMPFAGSGPVPPRRSSGRSGAIGSICLITKDYPPNVPGGIPRAVQMQAHMLAAAGVEVHVITKADGGVERVRDDEGVTVHELPEPALAVPPELYYLEIPVWSWAVAAKYAQLDASVGFDIVETPDYRGEALHLAPRPETALIVWLHSTMTVVWDCTPGYTRTPADDVWHTLEMAAIERAELVLAPSHLILDETSRLLGERLPRSEFMPYLFDATRFPAVPRERDGGPLRVLFYGRLEARKNPELALHALAAARRRGLDAELTVLGRDNEGYRERVMAPLERSLGIDDVRYVSHADADGVRELLAESDVAILASRFDNSPLTILESLSSGLPVITSDRVGIASWVKPEDGLLTLPIDDAGRFGEQAADAFGDAEWMASGARAAKAVREMFDPGKVTERLLDCYRRVRANRGPKPRRHLAGVKGRAVLSFADEVTADPSLLKGFAGAVGSGDDVTLVIYAPGWSGDDAARISEAVEAAGVDGDDGPPLLALAVPQTSETEELLAEGCEAVLTRREPTSAFACLRHGDEGSIADLLVR